MSKSTLSLEEKQQIEKRVHNAKTDEEFKQFVENFIQLPKTRPTNYHKKKNTLSLIKTNDIDISPNEALSECCVSNWLFGQAPVFHQAPTSLVFTSNQPVSIEPQARQSFDPGAFPNDPILISLRSRLKNLSKS